MKKEKLLNYKIYYTIIILAIYVLCRGIPLYGVDVKAYSDLSLDIENIMMQVISGDRYRYSVFALGISPYMISTILVQMVMFAKKAVSKDRILPSRVGTITLVVTVIFSAVQAYYAVEDLIYYNSDLMEYFKLIDILEMVTGAMLIVWLLQRNKKYGIGGQTAIIFVNILDSIVTSITKNPVNQIALPLLIAVPLMLIMLLMENTEYRIPMQRISIHNIYSDENYIAIKMNPIGAMPIMFAMSIFMLLQMIVSAVGSFLPQDNVVLWFASQMELTNPRGIMVYVGVLFLLTILFSFMTVNPGDLTEQLLKSGDSIVNIRAGKETGSYLRKRLFVICMISATVMSLCVGLPLILQIKGYMSGSSAVIPSTAMMLVGIWSSIYHEILAVRSFDSYESFL